MSCLLCLAWIQERVDLKMDAGKLLAARIAAHCLAVNKRINTSLVATFFTPNRKIFDESLTPCRYSRT
jgi:hypothetical protein